MLATLRRAILCWTATIFLTVFPPTLLLSQEVTLFAVVTKVGKDKRQLMAQVTTGGTVSEAALIAEDTVQESSVWRTLEICHSLRVQAEKVPEGYKVLSVKMLDAGMLPMPLQGIAGDCLLKKALEFAPLVD